jgi:hypothetical protein
MTLERPITDGVTFNSVSNSFAGFTLFTPAGGTEVLLIGMKGEVVHGWNVPQKPACQGFLLPNGHLLCAGKNNHGRFTDFRGSGGYLLELDWNGHTVWEYQDECLHHTFCRMKNGKTLVLKWIPVPQDLAARVRGGIAGSEKEDPMWADAIEEITPSGHKVWEWKSYEHLDVETDIICPLDPRDEWTHANHISVFDNGDILISLCRINTIAIIEKATGNISWRWGAPYELGHQNCAEVLPNGNILVFDNGLHPPGFDFGYSRVLEIDPNSNAVVWAYQTSAFALFYSSIMGGCQRLPNGNTLICESMNGRIFEVTSAGDIVWEYISPYFHDIPGIGHSNIIFNARRFEPDYAGLTAIDNA